jgi:hypothetical protein
MKQFEFRLIIFLLCVVLFISCSLLTTFDQLNVDVVKTSLFKLIIMALLAIYEVIVRIIPSVGNYSLIAFIIDMLKKLSDVLNVKKKV